MSEKFVPRLLLKQLEVYKNKVRAMESCLTKIRNDASLWKPVTRGGADQYLGCPPAMREIDEALRHSQELSKELEQFKANLKGDLKE